MTERTVVIIKPDGVEQRCVGKIITWIEELGLDIQDLWFGVGSRPLWTKHYEEHRGKDFFDSLVSDMAQKPIVIIVCTGENAVACMRAAVGPTDPASAPKDTIRGMYGTSVRRNVIHASDSVASADREYELWTQ